MQSISKLFRIGHGPSSSHTMGPGRAAARFRERTMEAASYTIHLYGSLGATGEGHLTPDVLRQQLAPCPVTIHMEPKTVLPQHPNGMRFVACNGSGEEISQWTAFSVGGGAVVDEADIGKPVQSTYPLTTMDDIMGWCLLEGRQFWEFVEQHEQIDVTGFLTEIWDTMQASVQAGLSEEGVLPGTLRLSRKAASCHIKARNAGPALQPVGLLSAYGLAVSEHNASGGKVVTAPTCGSAGVLPSVLVYLKEAYLLEDQRIHRALATAGLVGCLVKFNASISGAEVGCQGEIGTACAMAAAAAAQLLGGSINQIEYAAEMGLEHHLGLTCDPVGGYVQIPCIERNAVAAGRALQCATFALFSDGRHRISFDEVVTTMKETGRDLSSDYKETSVSGLARHWLDSENRGR